MSLRILRGFTLFINDTRNLFFEIETMKLATMEENTETFQPGGSDMEMAIAGLGVKAFEVPFKCKAHSPDVAGLFGGPAGVRHNFTGRKLVIDEKDGTEYEHAVDIRGRLTKVEAEEMAAGKVAGYDHTIGSIDSYSEMWDGRVMHRFNFWTGGWETWNFEPVNSARRRILFS
ncbi:phage major tail tube protein [Breoghania sp. JC706]|uniref:phage major tail tube protein n=1 Tax=Breoghania sp. JC706 TaxID=3117732 RepID=UPI00300B99E3